MEWTLEVVQCSGTGCFEIKIQVDTNVKIAGLGKSNIFWSEKVRCSSKMKPRLRAERVVLRGQFLYLGKLFESNEKKFSFRSV